LTDRKVPAASASLVANRYYYLPNQAATMAYHSYQPATPSGTNPTVFRLYNHFNTLGLLTNATMPTLLRRK